MTSRNAKNVQRRWLRGPGGQGACSATDRKTIKRVTNKRRRRDDHDHIDEQTRCVHDANGVCVQCQALQYSDGSQPLYPNLVIHEGATWPATQPIDPKVRCIGTTGTNGCGNTEGVHLGRCSKCEGWMVSETYDVTIVEKGTP
jgi:hypothetical protein